MKNSEATLESHELKEEKAKKNIPKLEENKSKSQGGLLEWKEHVFLECLGLLLNLLILWHVILP